MSPEGDKTIDDWKLKITICLPGVNPRGLDTERKGIFDITLIMANLDKNDFHSSIYNRHSSI
jgi:hypothetical protein